MAISLSKNQTISLEKEAGTGLKKIRMGLGWDPVKPSGFFAKLLSSDAAIDLDAGGQVATGNGMYKTAQ